MPKEISKEDLSKLLNTLTPKLLIETTQELEYMARDNGYDDDMLCQINEILYEMQ